MYMEFERWTVQLFGAILGNGLYMGYQIWGVNMAQDDVVIDIVNNVILCSSHKYIPNLLQ